MMLATGLRAGRINGRRRRSRQFISRIHSHDMTAGTDIPKASPRSVADRSLDALEAGRSSVFADRLAELVHDALLDDMACILDDPQTLMTQLIASLRREG